MKLGAFDDLLIVLYTPARLYVYRHDHTFGLSTQGISTASNGHAIKVRGKHGDLHWHVALGSILGKLNAPTNACELIFDMSLTDKHVIAACAERPTKTEIAFSGVPLSTSSSAARGMSLEAIAQRVDDMLRGVMSSEGIQTGFCINGARRAWHQRTCDWIRISGERIECKSSQLYWDRCLKCWACYFRNDCFDKSTLHFDELQLALYTPCGIFIYRHDLHLGVSSNGVRGFGIKVYAARWEFDWRNALDQILAKLEDSGCQRIAYIEWD